MASKGDVLYRRPGISARFTSASPDGRAVLSGFADGAVVLVDVETKAARELSRHDAEIVTTIFSPDGRLAAVGDATGEMSLFDVKRRALLCRWSAHPTRIRRLAFSPDGTRIASSSIDGALHTWPTDLDDVDRLALERRPRVIRVGP